MKRQYGSIYFITDGEAIKIGFSRWPDARLDNLQSAHSKPLTIINTFPGLVEDERSLHQHFATLRVRGEWFRLDRAIYEMIDRLEAARKFIERHQSTVTDVVQGRPPRFMLRTNDHYGSKAFSAWCARQNFTPEMAAKARIAELTLQELDIHSHRVDDLETYAPRTWASIKANLGGFAGVL